MVATDQSAVTSPCSGLCRLNAVELCVGCGRTRDEIAAWGGMSDEQRRAVLAQLDAREGWRPPA